MVKKTRKQPRRKHRVGGGDMTEAQMQALLAREKSVAEGIRSDMARLAAISEARIEKLKAENKKHFDEIKAEKAAKAAEVAAKHAEYTARPKRSRRQPKRYE